MLLHAVGGVLMKPKLVRSRFSVTALVVISIMFWGVTFSGDWQRYSVDERPPMDVIALAVGDVDNDGDNEVVAGGTGSGLRIYDGAKCSWNSEEIVAGLKINSVTVSDADNDGEQEVVCGTADKRVILYQFTRNEWIEHIVDANAGKAVLSVACGDADNDSYIEIVAGTEGKKVYIYEGSGDSWTKTLVDGNAVNDVMAVAVGDADGDGQMEIVCGTMGKRVYVYEKNGESWERSEVDRKVGSAVRSIDIGDCDGDGAMEIVVGTDEKGVNQYKWDGSSWSMETIDSKVGGEVYGVRICDVGDDVSRRLAVIVRRKKGKKGNKGNRLLLYKKGPSGWVSTEVDAEVEGEATALAIGDANDDGHIELLAGTSKKRNLFIYDQWAFYGLQKVTGTDDIVLNWPGKPGITYEVFYSHQPYAGFQYVAGVSAVTDSVQWIDDGSIIGVHPKDVVARYYRIRLKGFKNFSNTVGKFSRALETEMHLVSMPLIPYSTSVQDVIGDQLTGAPDESYADRVWKWDADIQDFAYAWLVDGVGPPFDGKWWSSGHFGPSTMTLNFGEGFFIQTRHENQMVTFLGSVPECVVSVADIRPGLQMIGTPSPEILPLDGCGFQASGAKGAPSELLADRVWYWDEDGLFYTYSWLMDRTDAPEDARWWSSDPMGPTKMTMIPGQGYWYQARGTGFAWSFARQR